jgi:hypothetical protein
MSFIAAASDVVGASPGRCFERFVDFSTWRDWMPRSFRPVRGPSRALRPGDELVVRIGVARGVSLPARLTVCHVDAGRRVGWRGGPAGVLVGEHDFLFEDGDGVGEGTRLRSHEVWSGALTHVPPLARRLRRDAERVGAEQIAAFKAWIERG